MNILNYFGGLRLRIKKDTIRTLLITPLIDFNWAKETTCSTNSLHNKVKTWERHSPWILSEVKALRADTTWKTKNLRLMFMKILWWNAANSQSSQLQAQRHQKLMFRKMIHFLTNLIENYSQFTSLKQIANTIEELQSTFRTLWKVKIQMNKQLIYPITKME